MAEKKYEVLRPLLEHAPGDFITAEDAGGQEQIDRMVVRGSVKPAKAPSKGGK